VDIDFIPEGQLAQYLDLYKMTKEKFVERVNFLETDGTSYIKTYLGTKFGKLNDIEKSQLLKFYVWWRIYGDLNLQEGEHYKRNFDTLIKGFQGSVENPRQATRKIMVI